MPPPEYAVAARWSGTCLPSRYVRVRVPSAAPTLRERGNHMAEKIARTVTATVIHFSEAVIDNGAPAFKPYPDEIVADAIDTVQAMAYLRKKYGEEKSFLVTGLDTSTKKYEMDLSVFVVTATPVADKTQPPVPAVSAEKETAEANNEPVESETHVENSVPISAGDTPATADAAETPVDAEDEAVEI